jgi:ribonuclease HII
LDIHNKTIAEISSLLQKEEVTLQLLNAMRSDSRSGVQKLLEKYYREQEAIQKQKDKSEQMLLEERRLWEEGYTLVGGVDEVGRGPLAGPVVASCVILPKGIIIEGVDDSKKLTPAKREELYEIISEKAEAIGLGVIDHKRIDEINIYNATIEAMMQAVSACKKAPEYLLLDAMHLKELSIPQLPIIGGDGKSQSIAAASIIAKVTRDRMMVQLAEIYPEYGFEKHKGYCTDEHVEAIRKYGMSPIHRRSFMNKIL